MVLRSSSIPQQRGGNGTKKPLQRVLPVEEAAIKTAPMLIFQNPLRVCRNWHHGHVSASSTPPGCRGFTGPVPPPLWMRNLIGYSIAAHDSTGGAGCQVAGFCDTGLMGFGKLENLPAADPSHSESPGRPDHSPWPWAKSCHRRRCQAGSYLAGLGAARPIEDAQAYQGHEEKK